MPALAGDDGEPGDAPVPDAPSRLAVPLAAPACSPCEHLPEPAMRDQGRIVQELSHAKFSEALRTVGKQLDFTGLCTSREELRYRIIEVTGVDLNGYHLQDAAIDYLEQTPLTQLDPAKVLDAHGIRKITELTGRSGCGRRPTLSPPAPCPTG